MIIKRSLTISGHQTSITLEEPFWVALKELAAQNSQSIASFVAMVDQQRESTNLSSAIRVYILQHYKSQCNL